MRGQSKNGFSRTVRSARGAFTFIELIVAVALSIVLLRGLYTIFDAATDLTRLSEERVYVMLEVSAAFDYMADDLGRVPYSGDRVFKVSGGNTLVFRALSKTGGEDVYIRYRLVSVDSTYSKIVRGVFEEEGCTTGVDEDGDGSSETGMVVARRVRSFSVRFHKSGDINGSWSSSGEQGTSTRAVKFVIGLDSTTPGTTAGSKPAEVFTLIIPVMSA